MLAQVNFQSLNFSLTQTIIALCASLLASIAVYLMYHLFYGSKTMGAGVNRTFLLGGPAVTALFLGIQSSIPLSLGLLGALSFVRFRTPVKDPAEIGFLLLLIAGAIGIATGTYPIVIILYVIAFAALSVQWLLQNRFSLRHCNNLMVSLDHTIYTQCQPALDTLLNDQLDDLRTQSTSIMDDRISLHFQFKTPTNFGRADFLNQLNRLTCEGKPEVYLGSEV